MANKKDSLGDRMKEYYENRYKIMLTRRTPVIIRIDGKAFHSFTKKFEKPYDSVFHEAMNDTLKRLCENIQGCKFGYTQSDEISLLLTDYDTLNTDGWFNYELEKICSIAASMATLYFNQAFRWYVSQHNSGSTLDNYDIERMKSRDKGALFDARAFNIPEDDVVNYFIWRQQDCTRNAIQMLGQTNFSHKELQGKSCSDIQDMLMLQKNINFNDMPVDFKRGVSCVKKPDANNRNKWTLDFNNPIFTQDREYIKFN